MKLLIAIIGLLSVLTTPAWPAASRSFDGTNDRVDIGNVLDVTTGSFSIGIWVKPTENASYERFIGKRASGGGVGYETSTTNTDLGVFAVDDGSHPTDSKGSDLDGKWTFVTGVYNALSNDKFLYENGIQVDSDNDGGIGSISNATSFRIGEAGNGGDDYTGLLAYGFFWNGKVMSRSLINEFMWKPDLMSITSGYWPLWGTSTTEPDLSTNSNNGTVSGSVPSGDGPRIFFSGIPL